MYIYKCIHTYVYIYINTYNMYKPVYHHTYLHTRVFWDEQKRAAALVSGSKPGNKYLDINQNMPGVRIGGEG
jgi:hypothetical protein